jgi:penicillin G amidase
LANDPHLGIQMPSIWYEIGLHCQPVSETCPFNTIGFAFPSSPLIVVGHNERIAWGVTDMTDDVADYYLMTINPDNPLQYQWNGEWREMTVREETIQFGDGEPPLTFQVRETHLGPIINDNRFGDDGELLGFNTEDPMALHWTAFETGTLTEAVLRLNQAANWDDFRDALSYWDVPSQNIVYADVDGNIGYQMPGRIPIRAAGHDGTLPVDGSTDAYEWRGFIPYDSLPRTFNPVRDYIVTANAAVAPLSYYEQLAETLGDEFGDANYQFTQQWDYGYRAQRLVELIEANAPHTAASFSIMQGDNKNISATELLPALANLTFDDATVTDARDWLLTWDYQNDDTSAKAALYMSFWGRLAENLFDDQLTEEFRATGSGRYMWATYGLLQTPDNVWWDDVTTADIIETRDDILTRSFREAYESNVSQFGSNRDSWRWGNLHMVTFVSNPLGASGVDAIENIFNRGPFTVGGGSSIVNATSWNLSNDSFAVTAGPSFRMVIDMNDFTNSTSLHTTGQSAHPYSPHYDDLINAWRANQPHPMLWTREQVEAAQAARLILNP